MNIFENTKTDQIDLVLTDYVMPEINKIELLIKIRERNANFLDR